MGYLFLFRPRTRRSRMPGGDHHPARDWQGRERGRGNLAGSVATTVTYGRGGIATMAMSALDIALWDALGKAAKLPLHRLWGHYRAELPAYGTGCFRGSGGDGMIAKALHYKERGYKAIKMQVAHTADLATDLDNVRRMREALGPDIDIMIDVNMGWTADVAILMGRKFQDYDVYWLEEPVVPDDFAGYFRIAEALDLRIVGGETHFTRFDLKPFFENPRLPILQPDPMRGGLTELRKIATVADTWGMTMAPHLFPELNVQLLASIPNGLVDRGHGAGGRPMGRSGASHERHDHRAGTAGPWACVQARDFARLRGQRRVTLMRPRHDRHGADRIGRRAIDDLGADCEVDDGVVRFIHHAVDAGRLEEDAGLLGEDFFVLTEFRQVDVDRADLPARDGKIGRIFIQSKRLAPTAFSRLRYVADDTRHLRVVKDADAHLVVGRQHIKRGAHAAEVRGVSEAER